MALFTKKCHYAIAIIQSIIYNIFSITALFTKSAVMLNEVKIYEQNYNI